MTKSMLSIFTVKPILRVAFGLVLLASIMLIFSSIGSLKSSFLARGASETESKKVTQADGGSSHTLFAPYYSVKRGLKATLMISNQGPNEMPVQVRLFSRDGLQVDLPAINLSGNETKSIDLGQHVSQGTSVEEGSVQVEYKGRMLELGGVVTLVDAAQSVIFDEELVEPARAFASSRLEGVWWRPTGRTEIQVALSNTSSSQVSVTVTTSGAGQENQEPISLALGAHETRVLSTENGHGSDELKLHGAAGGISIAHSSSPGALVAYGFVQEPSTGFSNVIDFSDPQKATATRLDGAGLRIGSVADQRLSQTVVVRNISSEPTTIRGHVPYTLVDGSQGVIDIERFKLDPGEVRRINLQPTIS